MKKPKRNKPSAVTGKEGLEKGTEKLSQEEDGDKTQIIEELDEEKIKELLLIGMHQQYHHSGPLPTPEDFSAYEEISPGAADRIIGMAEKEQEHRHSQERQAQSNYFKDRRIGYSCGFVLLALMIISALLCVYWDKTTMAYLFIGAALLSVVGKFIPQAIQHITQNKE